MLGQTVNHDWIPDPYRSRVSGQGQRHCERGCLLTEDPRERRKDRSVPLTCQRVRLGRKAAKYRHRHQKAQVADLNQPLEPALLLPGLESFDRDV